MVSINVDEAALREMQPEIDSTVAVRLWVQELVDTRMQQMRAEEEETMSIKEARAMVHAAIHEEYAKVCNQHRNGRSLRKYCQDEGIGKWLQEKRVASMNL